MPPLVDVEVIVVAAALGNEADEGGTGAVDIVGNDVGAEAGCGGGGPAGPPSGKVRIGAGDRLLAGQLTGRGGGGPAGRRLPNRALTHLALERCGSAGVPPARAARQSYELLNRVIGGGIQ